MKTAYKIIVAVAIVCCFAQQARAGYREDAMLEFINKMREQERARSSSTTADLHASYLNSTVDHDKRLISLALGASYLDKNPRLALQYLVSAELDCPANDPILPMIRYYLAEAKFRGGAFSEVINLSKSLLSTEFGDAWVKRVQSLLIESLYASGDFEGLTQAFWDYSKRFNFSRRQEVLARMAYEAFEKRGDRKEAFGLLEGIAVNYPATAESRWAFRKLEDATCQSMASGGYTFSEKLLSRLSKNVVLGNGLGEFIQSALSRPIVDSNGKVHVKAAAEKAQFYVGARLFELAKTEMQSMYEQERKDSASKILPSIILDLAKTNLRLFRPEESVRYLSDFIYNYPRHMFRGRAQELLGDALRYAGEIKGAAENYGLALVKRDTPILRWMHFWNLYRSKQYQAALALLEKPGYVTPREGDDRFIVDYWHAHILELLQMPDQANSIYRNILSHHGNSFYAAMVAVRHPELAKSDALSKSVPTTLTVSDTTRPSIISLAAKSMAARAGGSAELGERADLKLITDLRNVGLLDAAAAQLGRLRWVGFNQPDSFAAITRLSADLDDYRPSRNLRYTTFSSLRTLPSNWDELMRSQVEHADEWKVYYPLAYERIVVPMANHMQINPLLVLSIMRAESSYNKEARSPVGAVGLMQLMPYTALKIATLLHDEDFDIREVTDPEINIGYGLYYLDRLLRYYGDNPFLAAAAYNAGPAAVNQWLGTCRDCSSDEFVDSIPYYETRRYVREVIRNYEVYSRVYLGRPAMNLLPEMPKSLPENEEIF